RVQPARGYRAFAQRDWQSLAGTLAKPDRELRRHSRGFGQALFACFGQPNARPGGVTNHIRGQARARLAKAIDHRDFSACSASSAFKRRIFSQSLKADTNVRRERGTTAFLPTEERLVPNAIFFDEIRPVVH